jgi:5-methylcytosine-specific restriction endonuclease McrA
MMRIKNGKLVDPLLFIPNETRRSRAKNAGRLKQYLRNEANNYIKREAVREFVFARDNYKCVYCGSSEDLQVDHIVSIYQGGENTTENLQTLCKPCNCAKRVETWRGH